jgi:prevent-host-death family protein
VFVSELGTDRKGNIAEQAIALAATKLDVDVYRPVGEGGRYDLVFDVGSRLIRVQCKWARLKGDCAVVRCQSNRRGPDGFLARSYTSGEVDALAAYCVERDECYLIPIELVAGRREFRIRLAEPRNGQRGSINWARDFAFSTLDWGGVGAIAQLEERVHGMHEVAGSSPASSTVSIAPATVGAHEFRNRFGWYMERAAAGEVIDVTRRGRPTVTLGPAAPPPTADRV